MDVIDLILSNIDLIDTIPSVLPYGGFFYKSCAGGRMELYGLSEERRGALEAPYRHLL